MGLGHFTTWAKRPLGPLSSGSKDHGTHKINFVIVSLNVEDLLVTGSNYEIIDKFKKDMQQTLRGVHLPNKIR